MGHPILETRKAEASMEKPRVYDAG
jgi:hypothetical protein